MAKETLGKAPDLFRYPKYWAEGFGATPYLPMSHDQKRRALVIFIVSQDAYVDHLNFGMAMMERFLKSQGFGVGIVAQPDW